MDISVVEEDVARFPEELGAWVAYLRAKQDAPDRMRFAVFERALWHLPGSYKLWAAYLGERRRFAKEKGLVRFTQRGDGPVHEANCAHERALVYMRKFPRIWLDFAAFLDGQGEISRCRKTFDAALRALPVTQHARVWKPYLAFVEKYRKVWQLGVHVFPRYLEFQPTHRERFVEYLLKAGRPAEAMEQLGQLVLDKNFVSSKKHTLHDVWMQLCKLIVKFPDKAVSLGRDKLDVEGLIRSGLARFSDETGRLWCSLAEFFIKLGQFDRAQDIFEEGVREVATVRDFSMIFDAYMQYQEAMLTAKIDLFDDAEPDEDNDDAGIKSSFYQVNAESEDKINDTDLRLAQLTKLIDDRPFLLNEVLLRQNPHNVNEWCNRADLFQNKGEIASVVLMYKEAIEKVNPAVAVGSPSVLWIRLAKIYEDNEDYNEARKVLELAVDSPFKFVEDLVEVYCAWIEMELRLENFEKALKIVKQALVKPKERDIVAKMMLQRQQQKNQKDSTDSNRAIVKEKLKLQQKLYKSTKLWSLYTDLEESLGTLATARSAYEAMLDLKVATPQTILNFASMLEEHGYFEDSFKAFERGIALFDWPHVGEIWRTYLLKFIERYKGEKLERTRELFEEALASAPAEQVKGLFLLLANFEEQFGDSMRAMKTYERLAKAASEDQKVEMYLLAVAKAQEFVGMARVRKIFDAAVRDCEEFANLREICVRFAEKETQLGEIDRARAIYTQGAQFADPRTVNSFWKKFSDFEVDHGNEETFREMLRVKRATQVRFQETNYSLQTANEERSALEGQNGIEHSSKRPRIEDQSNS